jgi:membrane-associated protease RseP (regulator of RpoE activity)
MTRTIPIALFAAVFLAAPLADAQRRARGPDVQTWSFSSASGARLGVQVQGMTPELRKHMGAPEGAGVLVARLVAGGPAEKAGVKVGDVLVEVDGRGVAEAHEVISALAGRKAGDEVKVAVVRDRKRVELTARVEESTAGAALDLDPRAFAFSFPPEGPRIRLFGGRDVEKELKETREKVRELEKRLEKLERRR